MKKMGTGLHAATKGAHEEEKIFSRIWIEDNDIGHTIQGWQISTQNYVLYVGFEFEL